MSLFDGTGGDIWSSGFISSESPLKDLLDSGNYTLEQLLSEDELLQELKGLHPTLVTFLSKTTVCEELLSLLSFVSNNKNPAAGSEDELNKTIRFPYMACEVFCCEVNQITDTLVDGFVEDDNTMIMDDSSTAAQEFDSMASNDGSRDDVVFTDQNETIELDSKRDKTRLLDLFFNILLIHNEEEPIETLEELDDANIPIINDRLAGYFEKILTVLFRLRPKTISTYLNDNVDKYMPLFFRHISSYSIMQLLQRLLLPIESTPPPIELNRESITSENTSVSRICDWIDHDATVDYLLKKITAPSVDMNSEKHLDEISHCTEILISLLQSTVSPLEKLLSPAIFPQILHPISQIPTPYIPKESKLTHVLHIIEAMLLQLGGYGMHSKPSHKMKVSIIPFLSSLLLSLEQILVHPSTKKWKIENQLKRSVSQCGLPRFRAVRVLEALVLLGEERIDEVFVLQNESGVKNNILGIVCDLFWEMEWCSGVHQSVANMVVHIIEGKNKRQKLQNYLINEYNLIQKLLDGFKKNDELFQNSQLRLGYMGHVIIICQALELIESGKGEGDLDSADDEHDAILASRSVDSVSDDLEDIDFSETDTDDENTSELNGFHNTTENNTPSESQYNETPNFPSSENTETSTDEISSLIAQAIATPIPDDNDQIGFDDFNASDENDKENSSSIILEYIQSHSSYTEWKEFVSTTLAETTSIQSTLLGGVTAGTICSQEKSNAFDDFGTDHDIFSSSDSNGSLDVTESDLVAAVSMMDALTFGTDKLDEDDLVDQVQACHNYFYDNPFDSVRQALDEPDVNDIDNKEEEDNIESTEDDDDYENAAPVLDFFILGRDDSTSSDEFDDVDETPSSSSNNQKEESSEDNTAWANFADFDNIRSSKTEDDPFADSDDFFSSSDSNNSNSDAFSDINNTSEDAFFEADFSNFSDDFSNTSSEDNFQKGKSPEEEVKKSKEPEEEESNDSDDLALPDDIIRPSIDDVF